MNSLELIKEQINWYENKKVELIELKNKFMIEFDLEDDRVIEIDFQLEEYEDTLQILYQIKVELEAWKFVKEEVGFTIENIEDSRSSNFWGCKYGLKCYDEGIIPLSDKEVESFKKALEVKD